MDLLAVLNYKNVNCKNVSIVNKTNCRHIRTEDRSASYPRRVSFYVLRYGTLFFFIVYIVEWTRTKISLFFRVRGGENIRTRLLCLSARLLFISVPN